MVKNGFSLIELLIVLAIIGVIAAIAYPSYQNYLIKTSRVDMMSELGARAGQIEAEKLTRGKYTSISSAKYSKPYPEDVPLYNVSYTLNDGIWKLTATPIAGTRQEDDGVLSYNAKGIKCRKTVCGIGKSWSQGN